MGTNLRISALAAGSAFSTLDLIPFVDVSDVSISETGKTKKGTLADFVTYLNTVVTGLPTTNASLLTSGTVAFARLPVGTSSTSVAQGNHLHTGVYDPAGTAALITPTTLGLVIGTNVLAYSASTGTGNIVRAAGATLTGATLTTATINGALNTISNVPFTALSGNITAAQLPGGGVNSANELVQLTAAGKYPALDGSLITNLSSGFTNPMTTPGDVIYGGVSGAATRLAGNTTSTRKFLKSLGSAGAATAPSYDTLLAADVGLGNVENTALSSWTGSTSIETVGEILTGTWHGAAIDIASYSTGILPNAGFPATLPVASGVNLTALNASNLSSGTTPTARYPAGAFNIASGLVQLTAAAKYPALDGSLITNIDFSAYQTLLTNSAGLRAALSDETGTGAAVFATSPTLVTPVLGAAAATTINKVAITTPATGSTLTIIDGKTATFSNTITIAGTDGSTLNVGTGGTLGTAAYTAASAYAPTFNDSSSLRAILSDETGTGLAVFATSPTLITPALGVATCTSLNGCTINTSVLSGTNTGDQSLTAYATLASPALTGVPTAPTAAVATNTTQVATTAFVIANAGSVSFANPSGLIGMTASNGVATTAKRSDGNNAIDPAIAPVWTGSHTWSVAGGANAPAAYFTGAFYTGGTGTTAFPHLFIQPSGATASTTWSTGGTAFGLNVATGFAGNMLDFRLAGVSKFSVDNNGAITAPNIVAVSTVTCGSSGAFAVAGRGYLESGGADGLWRLANLAETAFTGLNFGTNTSSSASLRTSGTSITLGKADGTAGGLLAVSTPLARVGGVLKNYTADGGNSGTSETDLQTFTTIANTLLNNGDSLEFLATGIFVSSATATRQIRQYFAGTQIFDSGAITSTSSGVWRITGHLVRVSSTVVRYVCDFESTGAAVFSLVTNGELTGLTLTGTNILKTTGTAAATGAATNDIVGKAGIVKWFPGNP